MPPPVADAKVIDEGQSGIAEEGELGPQPPAEKGIPLRRINTDGHDADALFLK